MYLSYVLKELKLKNVFMMFLYLITFIVLRFSVCKCEINTDIIIGSSGEISGEVNNLGGIIGWDFRNYLSLEEIEKDIKKNGDRLEIIQAPESSPYKVVLGYGEDKRKCLSTGGGANMDDNYIPKERAVKLTINSPCTIILYANTGSTTELYPKLCISSNDKMIYKGYLERNNIGNYEINFDSPGTYYIYSQSDSGSLNIYSLIFKNINIVYKDGDINKDGKITEEDAVVLIQYLEGYIDLDAAQNATADLDNNGVVDLNDKKLLDEMLFSSLGYIPDFDVSKLGDFNDKSADFLNKSTSIRTVNGSEESEKAVIVESNNSYYIYDYEKCVQVSSGTDNEQYVPYGNAVKFYAGTPCKIALYISGGNSEKYKSLFVTSKNNLIFNTELTADIKCCIVNIEVPDVYYIYTHVNSGGFNLYDIFEVTGMETGDLDCDNKITYNDFIILQNHLNAQKRTETLCDEQLKLSDINLDGAVNIQDKYELLKLIKQKDYNYGCSNLILNTNKISLGDFYGYDKLHVLQVDESNSNKVKVDYHNNYYNGITFTKCIKTGGAAKYNNYVPEYRALEIKTEKACEMTVYAASGSATAAEPTVIISKKGQLINETPIGRGIQKITVQLTETNTYYIYSSENSGSANIYYIELKQSENSATAEEGASISFNVNKDENISYLLIGENIKGQDNYTYTLEYDNTALRVTEIGYGNKEIPTMYNIKVSEEITIIQNDKGKLSFKVNGNEKNWSGIIAEINFTGLKTINNTEIKFNKYGVI